MIGTGLPREIASSMIYWRVKHSSAKNALQWHATSSWAVKRYFSSASTCDLIIRDTDKSLCFPRRRRVYRKRQRLPGNPSLDTHTPGPQRVFIPAPKCYELKKKNARCLSYPLPMKTYVTLSYNGPSPSLMRYCIGFFPHPPFRGGACWQRISTYRARLWA